MPKIKKTKKTKKTLKKTTNLLTKAKKTTALTSAKQTELKKLITAYQQVGITNVFCLAIVRNYYVKMKGLTLELQKKNGHEQHQIDELKKEVQQLKA
ncbi:4874_t:CDS:2, partial [Funneliformis geosporum]